MFGLHAAFGLHSGFAMSSGCFVWQPCTIYEIDLHWLPSLCSSTAFGCDNAAQKSAQTCKTAVPLTPALCPRSHPQCAHDVDDNSMRRPHRLQSDTVLLLPQSPKWIARAP